MKSFFIFLAIGAVLFSSKAYSQTTVIKTNVLYDVITVTPNLGLEVQLSGRWSVGLAGSYNPWTFGRNRKLKHWLVQPEVRYWFQEAFKGHFINLHGIGGEYNISRWNIGRELWSHRYEGWLAGAGIGYGYSRRLKGRWSIELEAGLGYIHIDYTKSPKRTCALPIKKGSREYFGPTRLAVSFVYRLGKSE